MRFRGDSPEKACAKVIMGDEANPQRWAEFGGIVCMRTEGHTGACIALAGEAARADGVCHGCRRPLAGPCAPECDVVKS